MFTEIADAVTDWAVHLAFSPKVWLGVILAVLSVVLFVVSGKLRDRGVGGGTRAVRRRTAPGRSRSRAPCPKAKQPPGPLADDGIDDEIAEILKRRGIS